MEPIRQIEVIMWLSKALAWGIFLYFVACFLYGFCNDAVKALRIPDRFDIGYIDNDDPVAPQVVIVDGVIDEPAPKPKRKTKAEKRADDGRPETRKPVEKPVQPKKVVPKQTAKKSCPADDQLRQDCVDALVTLGTKKSEARRVAAQCLAQNPHIKTVQEFIPEVFKRGNA